MENINKKKPEKNIEEKKLSTYSCELPKEKINLLKEYLLSRGFIFKAAPYTFFSALNKKEKLSITAYLKGTLLIQGKNTEEFVKFYLEPVLLKTVSLGYEAALNTETYVEKIGVDESGKGDYFGPLVIGGVFLSKDKVPLLTKIEVKDSKKISDKKILTLAQKIITACPTSTVIIMPETYNKLFQKMKNLNKILAWGHARVIENLLTKVNCKEILIDKFGSESLVKNALLEKGKKAHLSQRHKAESDLAVAAASIIAKAAFLNRLEKISQDYNIEIHKGASSKVDELGKKIVEAKGQDFLTKIAKIHFKNTQKIV